MVSIAEEKKRTKNEIARYMQGKYRDKKMEEEQEDLGYYNLDEVLNGWR